MLLNTRWRTAIPSEYRQDIDVSVDLGAGRFPRNPLAAKSVVAVDVLEIAPFSVSANLSYRRVTPGEGLPIEDSSVDCISAFDFLEHLPRTYPDGNGGNTNLFISTLNEVHRALRPGGVFIAVTPCFPSPAVFVDPTHVNYITPDTHHYFSGPCHAKSLGYGFNGSFDCIYADWIDLSHPLWETYAVTVDQQPPQSPGMGQGLRSAVGRVLTKRTYRRSQPIHLLWVFAKTVSS